MLVSGESPRHLRRMAEAVLKQVRGRRLKRAAAFKNGIEGDKVDGTVMARSALCAQFVIYYLVSGLSGLSLCSGML